MKNPYYYEGANHTVDLVLVAPNATQDVLMIIRSENAQACPNQMAFPGGFVDTEAKKGEIWRAGLETHREAAIRELKEETNLELSSKALERLIEVGVFEGNARDPRDNEVSWSRSTAFMYRLSEEEYENMKDKAQGMDDASAALWVPMETLMKANLAFDHNVILNKVNQMLNVSANQVRKLRA